MRSGKTLPAKVDGRKVVFIRKFDHVLRCWTAQRGNNAILSHNNASLCNFNIKASDENSKPENYKMNFRKPLESWQRIFLRLTGNFGYFEFRRKALQTHRVSWWKIIKIEIPQARSAFDSLYSRSACQLNLMMCLESEHYVRLENLKILSLQVECIMNVLENFSHQRHSSSFNWLLREN